MDLIIDDYKLEYHLRCNHYPPYPLELLPVVKLAIQKANQGENDALVSLEGTGIEHERFGTLVPVSVIIDDFNLEGFITRK